MDNTSTDIYTEYWKEIDDPRPVFSKKQIIKNCFSLIISNPDQITDS